METLVHQRLASLACQIQLIAAGIEHGVMRARRRPQALNYVGEVQRDYILSQDGTKIYRVDVRLVTKQPEGNEMVARVFAGAICGAGPGILFGFGASAGHVMDIKFWPEQVPATVRAFALIGAIEWLVCVCIHAQR